MPDEPLNGGGRGELSKRSHHLADMAAELERTAGGIRLPERHLARLAGCGGNENPVVGDLFDPPARGTEEERFAGPGFEFDFTAVTVADDTITDDQTQAGASAHWPPAILLPTATEIEGDQKSGNKEKIDKANRHTEIIELFAGPRGEAFVILTMQLMSDVKAASA